jgi:Zn-dependent protease with chaperone function
MTSVASQARPSFTLAGTLQPPTVPLAYRVGLLLVAVAMVVLPLLYLCVVAGTASSVLWWATHPAWLTRAGTNQITLLAYSAPIIAGAILVFFMVKPIVARPVRRHDPIPLTPEEQPELFEFIDAICAQVRAPVPRLVQVDCQVNASASFMPVRFGVFQRGLVLTIGLPLVAGLSVRQFAGVLAHEFGHFAQGSGMRVTALVRQINYWFARVVFERDHWDAKLDDWSRHKDWRALIVVNLARGAIGVSRLVLKALMKAGHAVSSFLLRQMEYDADRYEIQLAGSVAFAQTMCRLRELSLAAHCAYQELGCACERNVLPADFPRFVIEQEGAVTEGARVASAAAATSTAWWHSHPCDRDRARAAEIAAAPGVLVGGEGPASALFRNLDALSAMASQHHYSHDLNLDVSGVKLVHGSVLVDERDQRDALVHAREEYFGLCISGARPLSVPWEHVKDWDDVRLQETMRLPRPAKAADAEQIANHYRGFEHFAQRRIGALAAEEFVAAGGTIKDAEGDTDLAETSVDSARSTQLWATASQQEHATALERFEAAVVQRLACGVVLASRADPSSDAVRHVTSLNVVASCMPDVLELFELLSVIQRLGGVFERRPLPRLRQRMQMMGPRVRPILTRMANRLADTPCPAMLTSEPVSIRAWCGLDGTGQDLDTAAIVNRMFEVYWYLLSEVVIVAMKMEG